MWSVLEHVLPVFALILVGWTAAKLRYIEAGVGQALAQFAFKIAMPALLFRVTLNNGTWTGDPALLALAFFGSVIVVWIMATAASLWVLGNSAAESTVIAMGACFGNAAMLGLLLALTVFGEAAQGPVTVIISLDTPVLWLLATIQMEAVRARDTGKAIDLAAVARVVREILFNPIITALILGTAGRQLDLTLPPLMDRGVALLQQAALPSALVALGLSLANFKFNEKQPSIGLILALKMIALPLFVFGATSAFHLPPAWIGTATLLAAMPVGANAYLFATRYQLGVEPMAATVAVSTACAIVTSTVVLWMIIGVGQ